jgi:hypothetical protein
MNEQQVNQFLKDFGEFNSELPLLKYMANMFSTQEKEQKAEDYAQKGKLFHTIVKKAFKAYLVGGSDQERNDQYKQACEGSAAETDGFGHTVVLDVR